VVQVLPAPRSVRPDSLEVPVGLWADPNVTPGRGNGKAAQAVESLTVADRPARLVQVDEAPAVAAASPAGLSTVGAAQAWHAPPMPG
jgi:hypothetical protein